MGDLTIKILLDGTTQKTADIYPYMWEVTIPYNVMSYNSDDNGMVTVSFLHMN
jgi:hypothetical protein